MQTPSLASLSIADFLDQLGSARPTPGGGSAAALTGAVAAALGQMVCALTVGRSNAAGADDGVRGFGRRFERARSMFEQLMDEDAAAYSEFSAALRLDPSDSERAKRIEQAATLAAEVPLEAATLSRRVHDDLADFSALANPNLKSDVTAGMHMAEAAMRAAAASVRANLPRMSPQAASIIEEQLGRLLTK